jgi:hypothetical protein
MPLYNHKHTSSGSLRYPSCRDKGRMCVWITHIVPERVPAHRTPIDINLRTVEFRLGEQLTGIGFAPARVDARATQRLHAVGDDALQG